MSAIKLKENLWSVGVLNPSLRVFDIVMEARYGTSYNAYLLTGEKNVLIETVHADYFGEYIDNIRQVLPLEQVDYLIMNHNEPDHSGSVARLLELCPRLQVIATKAGVKHLKDITNLDLPCRAVAAGDTLDLGDRVLEFIPDPHAPLGRLHVHLGCGGQGGLYLRLPGLPLLRAHHAGPEYSRQVCL